MKVLVVGLLFILFIPTLVDAQLRTGATHAAVTCTESNAGTRVVASIKQGVSVVLDPAATTGTVWVAMVDTPDDGSDNCATALTAKAGIPLSYERGASGWFYQIRETGYGGQLCCILDSGSTDMTLYVNGQ
jgi:hypothetical protein